MGQREFTVPEPAGVESLGEAGRPPRVVRAGRQQGFGFRTPSLIQQQAGEAIHALRHVGVLRAKTFHSRRERPPVQRLRFGELAVVPGQIGPVEHSPAGVARDAGWML